MPRRKAAAAASLAKAAPESEAAVDAAAEQDGATRPKRVRSSFLLALPTRPSTLGRVMVCGMGDMGQLGLGEDISERKRADHVAAIPNAVYVQAGGMHNLVLTSDGRVYSFGCNDEGALGRDTSAEGNVGEFEPQLVDLPGKVVKVSAGDSHSACLLEDGRVFAWGSFRDSHGNMGLTIEGNKRVPVEMLPGVLCCDIASGDDHLVILSCDGKAFTVGCGEQGQLGRVTRHTASGESRRGKATLLRPAEVALTRGKPIEAIFTSNFCTFVRESKTGKIYAFGLNNYKQLLYYKNTEVVTRPVVTSLTDVKTVSGGQHHTMVLKNDGSCHVIGRRDYGRLGLGEVPDDITKLEPVKALAGKRIVRVSCGQAQSFALTEDGTLYAWGMGSNLQLGTGSEEDALEPVVVTGKKIEGRRILQVSSGGQHTIFLVEDAPNAEPAQKNETGATVKESQNKKETKKKEEAAKPKVEAKKKVEATNGKGEDATTNGGVASNDSITSNVPNAEQPAAKAVKETKAAAAKGRKRK